MAHLTACDSTWQQDAISSKLLHKVVLVYPCKSTQHLCTSWMATYRRTAYYHTFLRKQFCLLPRWHLLRKCTGLLGHFLSWLLVLHSPVGLEQAEQALDSCGTQSEDMHVSHRDSSQQSLLRRCCSTSVSDFRQAILDVICVTLICLLHHAEFAKSAAKWGSV